MKKLLVSRAKCCRYLKPCKRVILTADSIIYETMRAGSLAEDWKNQVENRCAAIDDWYARWEPIGREFLKKLMTAAAH